MNIRLSGQNAVFFIIFASALLVSLFSGQACSDEGIVSIKGSNGESLRVRCPEKWESIDSGVEYKKITIYLGESFKRTVLKFVRLDPALFNVKIITTGSQDSASGFFVGNLSKKNGAVVIINGSYFDENRSPLGFLVSDGKIINKRVVTNWLYSGLFYVKEGKPGLLNRKDFPKKINVDQALQAGPLLIANGKPENIRNIHKSHFRSGLGLTGNNKICVYATETKYNGISWHELQQLLLLPGVNLRQAMNLDGGGSTQMALRTTGKNEYIKGTSKIPVAIGFYKKKIN